MLENNDISRIPTIVILGPTGSGKTGIAIKIFVILCIWLFMCGSIKLPHDCYYLPVEP